MKLLAEKPEFPDANVPHCFLREGEHKCVRPEVHDPPCYTFTIQDTPEGKVWRWYELENPS